MAAKGGILHYKRLCQISPRISALSYTFTVHLTPKILPTAELGLAREGIRAIIHLSEGQEGNLTDAMAKYRLYVFGEGMVEGEQAPNGPTIRQGIDPEKVREVLKRKGQLPCGEYVRCRVRYFTDGAEKNCGPAAF